jgi:hypothetical protein
MRTPTMTRSLAIGQHQLNRMRPTFMDTICTLVSWWGPRLNRVSEVRVQIVQVGEGFVLDIHWVGAE